MLLITSFTKTVSECFIRDVLAVNYLQHTLNVTDLSELICLVNVKTDNVIIMYLNVQKSKKLTCIAPYTHI